MHECVRAQLFSCIDTFSNSRTVVCQAPLSMGFSRQEYWGGLLFPTPEDLPWPRDQTHVSRVSYVEGRVFATESLGKTVMKIELMLNILTTHQKAYWHLIMQRSHRLIICSFSGARSCVWCPGTLASCPELAWKGIPCLWDLAGPASNQKYYCLATGKIAK